MAEVPIQVPLTEPELRTIVMALKLGEIRYGMLLQLAAQCVQPVLEFDTISDLINSLEAVLGASSGMRST